LPEAFPVQAMRELPELLARESARQWLVACGASPAELSPAVLDRLIGLAADAATTSRQHFPGGILVRRRGGLIFAAVPGSAGHSILPKIKRH
jgi:hypothetical protein